MLPSRASPPHHRDRHVPAGSAISRDGSSRSLDIHFLLRSPSPLSPLHSPTHTPCSCASSRCWPRTRHSSPPTPSPTRRLPRTRQTRRPYRVRPHAPESRGWRAVGKRWKKVVRVRALRRKRSRRGSGERCCPRLPCRHFAVEGDASIFPPAHSSTAFCGTCSGLYLFTRALVANQSPCSP